MRTNDEIQGRIKQILTRELDQRLTAAGAVLPVNCKHNLRHSLDVRPHVTGEPNPQYNQVGKRQLPTIGLCMFGAEDPTSWPGDICEDPIDAQTCSVFDSKFTRQRVQEEFQHQLKIPEWVKTNLPEVSGLLWVLGSDTATPPTMPWWSRALRQLQNLRKLWGFRQPPELSKGD